MRGSDVNLPRYLLPVLEHQVVARGNKQNAEKSTKSIQLFSRATHVSLLSQLPSSLDIFEFMISGLDNPGFNP